VLAGVPAPRAPYRGCLAEMDGFRFNSPSSCIPWIEERIEALRRALSSHREVGGCRLLTPPDEVPLHAVSVSRPEQPRLDIQDTIKLLNGNGRDEKAFPIDVRVEAPGEIVLVLNTYQPAIWRISVAPGSRVAAVLSISYHPSRVEGLAPDIPLVMTDYKTLSATPPCRHLWSSGMEAYRGGPDAMIFDRQVQALTGRSLETLRGASNLKSIVVR
jgi:hypothetical protein